VVDLNYQYVNCWEDHTRFKTLYRLLDGIDNTFDIHRQSTPKDELLNRLREYDGPPYVVILDEVDQLQDKSLLYDLYRMPDVTMVLIANREEDVFSTLGGRLNSRLESCARIRFGQYDIRELVTILEDRARWGIEPDAVSNQELELIADYAAGDARVAIGIFRNAARVARQSGDDQITVEVIDRVVSETKSEIRQKTTDKLTAHQQILYDTIKEAVEIGAGDLYDAYCETVDDPKTRRTMRNHLSKLEQALTEYSTQGVEVIVVDDEVGLLGAVQEIATNRLNEDRHYLTAYNGETWKGGFDLPYLQTIRIMV